MMRRLCLVLLAGAALAAAPAAAADRMRGAAITEDRIALVIGNAAYRNDPLDNPVNDARLIGQSLRQAGFTVSLHENLDRASLLNALREFGNRLNENTIAVLYYAGHGLQLRDRNYLIPVDEFVEVELRGLRVLSREELRQVCDREKTKEAILEALEHWPRQGIPDRPGAWMLTTARHKALDRLRRNAVYRDKLSLLVGSQPGDIRSEEDDRARRLLVTLYGSLHAGSSAGNVADG